MLGAIRTVEAGVTGPEEIDNAMALVYGHPVGPLRLADLVGLDVQMDAATYLHEALVTEVFRPPELLERMVQEGKLKKNPEKVFSRGTRMVGRMSADPLPDSTAGAQARLEELRERIIAVDDEIIQLIGERQDLVLEIGRIKESLGLPILDPTREARVVRRVAERSRALGVDEELTRDVIWRIISSARQTQSQRSSSEPPPKPTEPSPEP